MSEIEKLLAGKIGLIVEPRNIKECDGFIASISEGNCISSKALNHVSNKRIDLFVWVTAEIELKCSWSIPPIACFPLEHFQKRELIDGVIDAGDPPLVSYTKYGRWMGKEVQPKKLPISASTTLNAMSCAAAPEEGDIIKKVFGTPSLDTDKVFADRYNTGKLQWSLVDMKALEPMVEVLMAGAKKYSPDNWKKGLPVKDLMDSLQRHYVDFSTGIDLDEETQLSHVGHMMCNLMFISWMLKNKPELDNRHEKDNKVPSV